MQASNSSVHRSVGLPMAAVASIATAVFALWLLPGEAVAKTSHGGTLSGSTSQGNPGRIRVSGSGAVIREASITVTVRCAFGPMLLPQKMRGVPIAPGGRFRESLEDAFVEEGITFHLFESFSGKFNADRTKVVVRSRIYLHLQGPEGTTETCDSGTVTLRAHR